MTRGFTLLEVLVGVSILTASFLGVLTIFDRLTKTTEQATALTQASFLLDEGLEAVRVWRDVAWSNLGDWSSGEEYYLEWSGSQWSTSTAPSFLDGKFERRVKLQAVSRDSGTGDIVESGGDDDPGTKLLTVTVAWWSRVNNATSTRSASAYFTNLFE